MLESNPNEFNNICEDLIRAKDNLDKIEPYLIKLSQIKEK